MPRSPELLALDAFSNAATRVPAYRHLLRQAGLRVEEIQSPEDFRNLPVLGKQNTFQRFEIQELCLDGSLGQLGTVLTSSGHSGIFAFGLTDSAALDSTVTWIDDALDSLFAVRSRTTLLINCLPMGVKIPTRACTLAETSVRPDMAVGLVKIFGPHYDQIILVGEAAFLKHMLEIGIRSGIRWRNHLIQVIVGEEPLAENARRYLQGLLGHDLRRPEKGILFSSMGIAEVGLNLFFEAPPVAPLILLRRILHDNLPLRQAVLGSADSVPSLFTYDPRRIFVEFDASGQLILTTLDLQLRLPLIRYATGDQGGFVHVSRDVRPAFTAEGLFCEVLEAIPIVAIRGRGEHASARNGAVYPEAVKEGIYHDPELAALTTGNFRLKSDPEAVRIRLQLSPGVRNTSAIEAGFRDAISRYVKTAYTLACEHYDDFGSGMALDYERKFQYLGP